jgi:cyclase
MLTKRIIPCLDVKDGRVVKGVNFVNLRDAGDPVECGEIYSREGADELVFLDITATSDARNTVADMVRRVAERVFIPFTVGGGIRTVDDMKAILREGADKISVNSSALNRPELIKEGADHFGRQCIVVAIDARKRRQHRDGSQFENGEKWKPEDGWTVFRSGGRIDTGTDAIEWAERTCDLGAGELLVTSMDCDGTKAGYDIDLTRTISEKTGVPIIASGGAGTKEHFYDVLTEGKADAALAASLFHYRELSIEEVKTYLKERGIPVRA